MKTRPQHRWMTRGSAARQNGSILIIVLWIAFGLVSLTLYFADSMNFQFRAADNRVAAMEAEEAIEGMSRYISCVLSNLTIPGTMPDPSSYRCEAVSVGNATCWIIGRGKSQDPVTAAHFGLVDECSKLNLNTATATNLLQMFPMMSTMTLNLAASIAEWKSGSNDMTYVNMGGADSSTYVGLQPPYNCKNAPYESVDELRLIYNMDMPTLYGEDANLNGILDANENDGPTLPPADNQDGQLDGGLLDYVTVYSRQPNTGTNGAVKANVNPTTTTTAGGGTTGGGGGAATGGRGAAPGGGAATGGGARGGAASGGGSGLSNQALETVMETSGIATARAAEIVQTAGAGPFTSLLQFYGKSQMTPQEFSQIESQITTTNKTSITGLINVNTASAVVLSALPNMDINTANQIVGYRDANNLGSTNSMAWIIAALSGNTQLALAIGPYITGQTYQYSADIAAVGHGGRGYRRVRFVFDTSSGAPTIIYREDLTHLGWALGKEVRQALLAKQKRR
jgi:type II secretory pathway component PulK